MLDNCLVVTNAKGGVRKTSLVANLAASAAAGGWHVLAADLDPEGNLARDLGYWEASDGAALAHAALAHALRDGVAAEVVQDVRPGLDVLAGGRALAAHQATSHGHEPDAPDLEPVLGPLAGHYDLVLLDTPPSSGPMQHAALAVPAFALIPTKIDDVSIDGLEGLDRKASRCTVTPCAANRGSRRAPGGDRRSKGETHDVEEDPVAVARSRVVGCGDGHRRRQRGG